jgi:hypothetical protein
MINYYFITEDITKGLDYDKDYVSLSALIIGKLAGKTAALSWDAQGNVTFNSKVSLNGADLQSTLDTIRKMPGPQVHKV